MFNDFVWSVPRATKPRYAKPRSAADAMRRIAMSTAVFVSRGDESGTHAREQQLWQKAGVKPPADRLLETGQSMAATLRIASERHAYTLTDRATFTQLAHALTLQPLFEHDPDLLNTYAVIVLRRRCPRARRDAIHDVDQRRRRARTHRVIHDRGHPSLHRLARRAGRATLPDALPQ